MKKLSLIVVTSQQKDLLRELMLLGCVQVSEPKDMSEENSQNFCRIVAPELSTTRANQQELKTAIDLLGKYSHEKKSFFSPLPNTTSEVLLGESRLNADLDRARYIIGLEEKIRRSDAEIVREQTTIDQLTPWINMDIPLSFRGTERSKVLFATLPASVPVSEAALTLSAAAPESQLYEISTDKLLHYVAFVAMDDEVETALEALRPLGLNLMQLHSSDKTAANEITESENEIRRLGEAKLDLAEKIKAEAIHIDEIRFSYDTLGTMIERYEAESKLISTDSTVILEGWVPAENEKKLGDLLSKYDCAWGTSDPEEEEYPEVPVKLKNNIFTRALNMVTEMYSLPAYDGVDPNPLMAPFFILFYGIMLADMGYGLIMVLLGALVLAKKKPKAGTRTFFELMLWCGLSTIVFGALTGGFFGDAPLKVAQILNPQTTWQGLPALFTPLNDTVMILLGSMCLGFIHIITGMIISFVEKAKSGHIMDGIWDEGSWWVIFIGAALMALKIGTVAGVPVVLVIGALMLVIGAGRDSKGFGKVTAAFNAIYSGVTGYFGDILSYSRLMALMLAGSVIASVFNIIGAIPGNIFVFLIISIIGNALNFALNLLGCYVHDLRLQCLEFFGKFYKDGGKPFKPLAINTKFVNVTTDK